MRGIPPVRFGCLILLLGLAGSMALAQTPPASNTLQVPSHRTADTPPKPPSAAPVKPVQQVGPGTGAKKPPVVEPKGTPHAQKPGAHPSKQSAKPAPAAGAPTAAPAAAPEAVVAPPVAATKPSETGKSKLPVPRFAALRFDDVNMRRGPGPRYPIEWVYKRRDLPVEIERDFDIWRLIRDPDGTRGWVSEASLTGRRTFIVTGSDATLRRDAADTAGAVAILKPGVIGRIRNCQAGAEWCQVQAGDYRGYLKREQFWGTQPGEAVTP